VKSESKEAPNSTKKAAQLFFSLCECGKEQRHFNILNQHNIDMIIDIETFYEVDEMERIGVADPLINDHIFRQNETLVGGK
jgi:hypothetical protein